MACWLAGRLVGWLAGLLADWLAGLLAGWLAGYNLAELSFVTKSRVTVRLGYLFGLGRSIENLAILSPLNSNTLDN